MTMRDDRRADRPHSRRRAVWLIVAALLVVGLVGGLGLFQPWKLFTRSTVDEAAPMAVVAAATVPLPLTGTSGAGTSGAGASATAPSAAVSPTTGTRGSTGPAVGPATSKAAGATPVPTTPAAAAPSAPPPATDPAVLASGTFVDGEHPTTGTASVVRLTDGSRYVRLEQLSTSDGPDVQVWITDQQAGGDDWGKYDDGRYVRLGALKGTDGNQNYAVPADADLQGLSSVVIWCDRFNVAFGSAAIDL